MTHLGRAAMHVRRRAVVPALVHFPLLTHFPTQCVVVVVFREGIWFFSYSCILPFVAGLLESAVIRKKFEVGNQIQQIWRSLGIALKECKFSPSLSCFFGIIPVPLGTVPGNVSHGKFRGLWHLYVQRCRTEQR